MYSDNTFKDNKKTKRELKTGVEHMTSNLSFENFSRNPILISKF